jgi:signal transduction histidine kinase
VYYADFKAEKLVLNFVLEIVCAFLMAMSLIFIIIELRARFDRSFLIFGISNILLSLFCGIDLWIQPHTQTLYWTKIQHIIAAFFPTCLIWYLLIFFNKYQQNVIKTMLFLSMVFSVLFFTDLMLKPSEREVTGTLLYSFSFIPFILLSILYIVWLLIVNFIQGNKKDRKVILFHFLGIIALASGSILDIVTILIGKRIVAQVATFVVPGLLLFGIFVTMVFIDRLASIIKERDVMFNKLQIAYKEMEEVQSLKELGQSSAIINHEIRNYTFVISGYAQLLLQQLVLTDKQRHMLATISDTTNKMAEFSKEILNFSKAKILSDKRPILISNLIIQCIQSHFAAMQKIFNVDELDMNATVHGDWNKMEQVFVNLFKNAIEAEASQITIKTIRNDSVLLLVVEDNGVGCTIKQLPSLFKSFYTTKKGKGGTGLGMCIIRSIIEGHGGHINAYSKNILNNNTHGLFFTLAFPVFEEEKNKMIDKKDQVILVKDKLENLASIIRIFQNIMVNPHIFQSVDDITIKKTDLDKFVVFGSPGSIRSFQKKIDSTGSKHMLTCDSDGTTFVVNENLKTIHVLSEKYVIESMS